MELTTFPFHWFLAAYAGDAPEPSVVRLCFASDSQDTGIVVKLHRRDDGSWDPASVKLLVQSARDVAAATGADGYHELEAIALSWARRFGWRTTNLVTRLTVVRMADDGGPFAQPLREASRLLRVATNGHQKGW